MSKYVVEFKQADTEGYIHTKRTYPEMSQAVAEAKAAMDGRFDFEYLVVRRVKDKTVTVKVKETK